ncbi:MAG: energy transducer TonB [Paludibacter sp.]|nr:energy transducer TonB [Paludibacter sp.]
MEEEKKAPTKTIIAVLVILIAAFFIYKVTRQKEEPKIVLKAKTEQPKTTITHSASTNGIYDVVEKMPEYPGGDQALMEFLSKHIKYPTVAQESRIQGKVILGFVVSKSGKVEDVQILRSLDPNLDKEALRVVKLLGYWKPGEQGGKKVSVRYTLPVVFRLQ